MRIIACESTQSPLCHCLPPAGPTAGTSQLIVLGKVAHSGLTFTSFSENRGITIGHLFNIFKKHMEQLFVVYNP